MNGLHEPMQPQCNRHHVFSREGGVLDFPPASLQKVHGCYGIFDAPGWAVKRLAEQVRLGGSAHRIPDCRFDLHFAFLWLNARGRDIGPLCRVKWSNFVGYKVMHRRVDRRLNLCRPISK